MGLFDNFKKAEVRSLENPNAPVSAENFLHIMGWGDFQSSAGMYSAEFEVTYGDGSIETFPNSDYIRVEIIDDIA